MAILHLVRCDACGTDTPMSVSLDVSGAALIQGQGVPSARETYAVPLKIKQVDGKHFCSYACIAEYASNQTKAGQL